MDQGKGWVTGIASTLLVVLGWMAGGGDAAPLSGARGPAALARFGDERIDAAPARVSTGTVDAVPREPDGSAPTAPRRRARDAGPPALRIAATPLGRAWSEAALGARLERETGGPVEWVDGDRHATLAAVRGGRVAIAVLGDPASQEAPDGLDVVELGDLVLVAVAPRELHPRVLTAAALVRLLSRPDADWAAVRGPRRDVERFTDPNLPPAAVALTLHRPDAAPRGTPTVDPLAAAARAPGGLTITTLAALERARTRLPIDDLALAVDCIRPTQDEFRRGRYPFGARLRLVASHRADPKIRALLADLRQTPRTTPVHQPLCRP